ncbi:MAG: glycosyltransferase family 39 protein [candidate division NC10 bacterium]|nr:glycosyltransferase family 39 protein [candidate division NC10 bacterium]
MSWASLGLIVFALVMRLPLLFYAPYEPDEFEHLHAAWAVAHGQVPFRDFWQLHPPLLYYLMAPVFTMLGEDLRIIYVARGFVFLCILLILLQLYRIARECFDSLTGLLAVLLLSYVLLHFQASYFFRPDTLEALVVIVGLWRFMRAWRSHRRIEFVASGAILGVGFWVLSKALFPLAGLSLVFVLSSVLRRPAGALRSNFVGMLFFLGAFAIPVVLGGFLLWAAGALPNFLRWGVIHTFRYPVHFSAIRALLPEVNLTFLALAVVGIVRAVARANVMDEFHLSPILAGSMTAAAFLFLMPAPNPQSALPFIPVAAMYAAEVLRWVFKRALPSEGSVALTHGKPGAPAIRLPGRLTWACLAALLTSMACAPPLWDLVADLPRFRKAAVRTNQTIRFVLSLAPPGDSVYDAHGLYIFRPHATYYYRLSRGIIAWLHSGLIPETEIMNDLWRNQCKVVIVNWYEERLPSGLARFLRSHYVYVSSERQSKRMPVHVAGSVLRPADLSGSRATVSLIASAEYAVRPQGGTPKIYLDGRLYQAPLFLSQGNHQIAVDGDFQEIAIFYSRVLTVGLGDSS